MKIALIGATGNVGQRLLDEALGRQHDVTAIARTASSLAPRAKLRSVDLDAQDGAALAAALQDHDVVISTARFTSFTAAHLLAAIKQAGVARLLVVGGAGSLEVAPSVALIDTPQFPTEYMQEASAGRDFLNQLRLEQTIDWSFLSPSALFIPGARTGQFRLDEIEQPRHTRRRFTVGY